MSVRPSASSLVVLASAAILSWSLVGCGGDSGGGGGGGTVVNPPGNDTDTTHGNDTGSTDTACEFGCTLVPGPAAATPYTPIAVSRYAELIAPIGNERFNGMALIAAKGETFLCGLRDSLDPIDTLSRPVHRVGFTYDYYMDKTEVTIKDFVVLMNDARDRGWIKLVTKTDPSDARITNRWFESASGQLLFGIASLGVASQQPISLFADTLGRVSTQNLPFSNGYWYAAALYANMRSVSLGLEPVYDTLTFEPDYRKNGFRLPTDAEYEFAIRQGVSWSSKRDWAYMWGDTFDQAMADRFINPKAFLYPVAFLQGNMGDMFDIIGNADEWTTEWYAPYTSSRVVDPLGPATGTHKIQRDNYSNAIGARSGFRRIYEPGDNVAGMRLVLPVR